MNFTQIPFGLVLAGALVLAAALYLLQQLKVRFTRVTLPTLMLWQEALADAPVRVLRQRFRYWWAYLLSLAIALLLWLAAAGVQWAEPAKPARLYYLDASATLAPPGRFEAARQALLDDLAAVPADERQVFVGGAVNSLLLDKGESLALLKRRLAKVTPALSPSPVSAFLRQYQHRQVYYYGAAALPEEAAKALVRGFAPKALEQDQGIVALGASPSASAEPSLVDVLIRVSGQGVSAGDLSLTLAGSPYQTTLVPQGNNAFLLSGLPANGKVLGVSLNKADDFAANNSANLVLPHFAPLKVAVSNGAPEVMRALVKADPGMVLSEAAKAEVQVLVEGEPQRPGVPALLISPDQQAALVFAYSPGDDAKALKGALSELGLRGPEMQALADQFHRPIRLELLPASHRQLSLWQPLLTGQSHFIQSRTLPVLLAKSLRWLAGQQPWVPYAEAGSDLYDLSAAYGLGGSQHYRRLALGKAPYLAASGPWPDAPAQLQVALSNDALPAALTQPLATAKSAQAKAPPVSLVWWLVIAASLLLALEWRLVQRGKMP